MTSPSAPSVHVQAAALSAAFPGYAVNVITPLCPDCYDCTGSVLFNACAPELWRRFTITLRRTPARQRAVSRSVSKRAPSMIGRGR